jgi:acyl-CoA synthetase (AMP-forming)/AMP-acid ligase II/acyl carrier protein
MWRPDRRAYTFLVDGETREVSLTYGELDRRARAIAASLRPMIEPGDRVLLLYPSGLDYIAAFFGCIYAGAVAVPAYPPRLNRNLVRLQAIMADAKPSLALTTTAILSQVVTRFPHDQFLQSLRWLTTDSLVEGIESNWQEPDITGETMLFLQYTSGSTSAPKGIMLSHNNVLHNERMIQQAFQQTEQSIILGWLPLYHDMGLIGNVIQTLYVGASGILMSPMAFLQRPFRWLKSITRYRATTSGGPNFAYDLCVRKITAEQKAELDLSSWSVAFNGSEPIRSETLENFANSFAECGFRREAYRPCYGLAEATLMVCGQAKARMPRVKQVEARALETNAVVEACAGRDDARSIVSCGESLTGQQVIIVDPVDLTLCRADQVGEVWVYGHNVAKGYWDRPEETESTFRARISDTGEGPFLRTGDLGFIQDEQLFVTGRLKDLIIIRGFNHYPQDIELTVEKCHADLRQGCGAAFSVNALGEERLVVVQEVRPCKQPDALIQLIFEAVAENHELRAYTVTLIKPGSLPKTSSGKVQRQACRSDFLSGRLAVVKEKRWLQINSSEGESMLFNDLSSEESGDPSDLNSPVKPRGLARDALLAARPGERQRLLTVYLSEQLARVLGIPAYDLDLDQSLIKLGIDSLMAAELKSRIETELGAVLPIVRLLEGPSIAQLTILLLDQISEVEAVSSKPAGSGLRQVLDEQRYEHISDTGVDDFRNAEDLLAKIDRLSDDEVKIMLSSILQANDGENH